MITKIKLAEILGDNEFEDARIERILNKKIKTLLSIGKANEIEKILKVLQDNGISKDTIENCLSVLAQGKANEIEKILEVLQDNGIGKDTIENCLLVLAQGKANEIEKILEVLQDNGISKDTIENCLSKNCKRICKK